MADWKRRTRRRLSSGLMARQSPATTMSQGFPSCYIPLLQGVLESQLGLGSPPPGRWLQVWLKCFDMRTIDCLAVSMELYVSGCRQGNSDAPLTASRKVQLVTAFVDAAKRRMVRSRSAQAAQCWMDASLELCLLLLRLGHLDSAFQQLDALTTVDVQTGGAGRKALILLLAGFVNYLRALYADQQAREADNASRKKSLKEKFGALQASAATNLQRSLEMATHGSVPALVTHFSSVSLRAKYLLSRLASLGSSELGPQPGPLLLHPVARRGRAGKAPKAGADHPGNSLLHVREVCSRSALSAPPARAATKKSKKSKKSKKGTAGAVDAVLTQLQQDPASKTSWLHLLLLASKGLASKCHIIRGCCTVLSAQPNAGVIVWKVLCESLRRVLEDPAAEQPSSDLWRSLSWWTTSVAHLGVYDTDAPFRRRLSLLLTCGWQYEAALQLLFYRALCLALLRRLAPRVFRSPPPEHSSASDLVAYAVRMLETCSTHAAEAAGHSGNEQTLVVSAQTLAEKCLHMASILREQQVELT